MIRSLLLWLALMVLPVWAKGGLQVRKLVDLNFEYVKLVYQVAQDCARVAGQYAQSSQDKALTIEVMRCYSFLLEKRDKLEREVFVPLRRAGFPHGTLSERDKTFITMVYVIDDSVEDVSRVLEPMIKQRVKSSRRSGVRKGHALKQK